MRSQAILPLRNNNLCLPGLVAMVWACSPVAVGGPVEWYDYTSEGVGEHLLSIGATLLSSPAGGHGFLNVEDGDLKFDDGTPARFWGVNITASALFPPKAEAETIAEDLARWGFNVVRFHHMDDGYPPRGIFKDTAPGSKDIQSKKSSVLDFKQLDRLDYFFYQLKQRGIYVDFNLLSARRFTTADGVKEADALRKYSNLAGKPASMFDRKLIELQKAYISDLLNHQNPYTKIRYKDDPALAFVEISNETSLFRYWMLGKLDSGILTASGGLPEAYLNELDERWAEWKEVNDVPRNAVRPPWKSRKLYTKEEVNNLSRFYRQVEADYFSEMTEYLKKSMGTRALVGASGHYYSAANLQAQAVTDFTSPHYYWDPLKWPGKQWDKSNYKLSNLSVFDAGTSKMTRLVNPVADNGISHVRGKPLLITEWNQWFPNEYGYELPLIFAAYGSLQDWDGAMVFAYRIRRNNKEVGAKKLDDFLEIQANPQKLIANSLAALVFLNRYVSESTEPVSVSFGEEDVLREVRNRGRGRFPSSAWKVSESTYLKHKIEISFDEDGRSFSGDKDDGAMVTSDTGELRWDRDRRYMIVDAPKIKGAMGFVSAADSQRMNLVGIRSTDDGLIALASLDGQDLASSTKLLLVCVGKVTNTGANWIPPDIDWGRAPIQMQRLRAEIRLPSDAAYTQIPLSISGKSLSQAKKVNSGWLPCPESAPWALVEKQVIE